MAIRLSPNEQAIMELIWSAGRPLSRQEILEGTDGRSWNPASIHLVLNNMLSKGILRIIAQYAEEVAKGNTQRDRTLDLAMCLVCRDGIDADTIAELEQMLDKKHLPDQPQKPTVVVTAPKKRGLFSQVLGLFKKRK